MARTCDLHFRSSLQERSHSVSHHAAVKPSVQPLQRWDYIPAQNRTQVLAGASPEQPGLSSGTCSMKTIFDKRIPMQYCPDQHTHCSAVREITSLISVSPTSCKYSMERVPDLSVPQCTPVYPWCLRPAVHVCDVPHSWLKECGT